MELFAILVCAVLGLVLGSFGNVAIWRWPRGESVNEPRHSACPRCGHAIRWYDNIPVASWLVLRGRCRDCGEPISIRYPFIEALTGALFGAVAWVHGLTWVLPALLTLTWVLVIASVIDLEHRIIPNRLTYAAAPTLLVLVTVAAAVTGEWGNLSRAAIAGVAIPAAMLALSELFRLVRGQAGIGMGDIKLAVSIGLVVGYLGGWQLVIFFYATAISAVVVAFGLIAAGRAKLATRIPYGPYLALGAMVAILAGGPLTRLLEGLLLPS